MNHEEKTDTYRSLAIADSSNGCTFDSKYSKVQSGYNSLRNRVRQMLSEGTATVRIIREIKNDEFCTGMQKKRILSELHLS